MNNVNLFPENDNFPDIISRMPPLPQNLFWRNYTSRLHDRSVLPSDEVVLIDLGGDVNDPAFVIFREKCRKILSNIKISVEYTDIYGGKFPSISRDLDWFDRNNI